MRSQYLSDEFVAGFIGYMSKVIKGDVPINITVGFSRSQLPEGFTQRFPGGRLEGRGSGGEYVVEVQSLQSLFSMYWWGRQSYDENARVLQGISEKIRSAIDSEYSEKRNELALLACHEVMKWGFGNGTRAYNSNMAWARGLGEDLALTLRLGRTSLTGEHPDFGVFGSESSPRMNSGWTKYYSLALPDFVIYDGRVGAALGLLVRKYLESLDCRVQPESVPESLSFKWASGRGENYRNPSSNEYAFSKLSHSRRGMKEWANVNVRANWILIEALELAQSDWLSGRDGLRKLEASLFMLGYDFSRVQ